MKNNLLKMLGNLIYKLRTEAKMTQGDLAQKASAFLDGGTIYRTDLSAFENHGRNITAVDKIDALLQVFGYGLIPSEKKTSLIST
jgi:transcriptional regulator with XRE-family HTH domain